MNIVNGDNVYHVGKLVGENKKYRLYICTTDSVDGECLLQVATDLSHNGDLSLNAYILKEMEKAAEKLEIEYAKVKTDPKVLLNYQLCFPKVVDTFIGADQGGRKINILSFRHVKKVGDIVPLINITEKDGLRIDLRTSVWIMGRLLKLLTLTQNEGISTAKLLSSENILIEPEKHYVIVFDWSGAKAYQDAKNYSSEEKRIEIAKVTQAIIKVLGGDIEKSFFPDDGEKGFERYTKHLLRLETGIEGRAEKTHQDFYQLVDQIWERKFYPFTTKPLF